MMDSIPVLLSLVGATGIGIAAMVYTGLRGLRRAHFTALGPTLAILACTIYSAESVGRLYTFEPTAFAVHMAFAWSATITLLVAAATGIVRVCNAAQRVPHRIAVGLFLLALVGALITGPWMISTGVLKSKTEERSEATTPTTEVVDSSFPATPTSGGRR